MQLEHALTQIAEIRRQMALSRRFRGFRAATTLATAAAALAMAAWQSWRTPEPAQFVLLWVAVAVACMGACAAEVIWRYFNSGSASQQELTRMAVAEFLPFVLVGGLLTVALWEFAGQTLWMLPGLWQILFGLGLYSLRGMFPASILFVAAFYVLCGLFNLSGGSAHFSPWSMGVPFGVGQAASALILYFHLERRHAA
jgi:hypothetical protein